MTAEWNWDTGWLWLVRHVSRAPAACSDRVSVAPLISGCAGTPLRFLVLFNLQ